MSFNYKKRKRVAIDFSDTKSLTEQHHKKRCDVHTIMDKYEKTGLIEHLAKHSGAYSDYPSSIDFHSAMNIIAEANSVFESLPADLRAAHSNDPSRFLDWIQDEKNRDEIIEAGFDVSHLPVIEVPQPEATGTSVNGSTDPATDAPQGTTEPVQQA